MLFTLLYGCESWSLKAAQEKQLDAFDSRCLRKILGIKWSDFITNTEVRQISDQPPVSATICKRRLKWLGHVARLPSNRLAHQTLWWTPKGRRRRGRPKMNWQQTIKRDLQDINKSWRRHPDADCRQIQLESLMRYKTRELLSLRLGKYFNLPLFTSIFVLFIYYYYYLSIYLYKYLSIYLSIY